MSDNSQIFISYSHDDEFFTHSFRATLGEKLTERGLTDTVIWMDNQKMFAGEDWVVRAEKAIRNSFAVLLVVSPAAMKSPNVSYEWAFAFGLGKTVIPIMYKDKGFDIPAKLRRRIQIRFKEDEMKLLNSLQWHMLLDAIEKAHDDSKPVQVSSRWRHEIIEEIRFSSNRETIMEAMRVGECLQVEVALNDISKHLDDYSDPEKQKSALKLIKPTLPIEDLKSVLPLLNHPEREVRTQAFWAIAKFPDEFIKHLVNFIENDTLPYRQNRAGALINGVLCISEILNGDFLREIELEDGTHFLFEQLLQHKISWVRSQAMSELIPRYYFWFDLDVELVARFLRDTEKAWLQYPEHLEYLSEYDVSLVYDKEHQVASVSLVTALRFIEISTYVDEETDIEIAASIQKAISLVRDAGFVPLITTQV